MLKMTSFYPREHAMLARVYILLCVVVVVVVVDALLNYCEFRHGCTFDATQIDAN
jgi:hypothetical protein